jgi:hypothetical protein
MRTLRETINATGILNAVGITTAPRILEVEYTVVEISKLQWSKGTDSWLNEKAKKRSR